MQVSHLLDHRPRALLLHSSDLPATVEHNINDVKVKACVNWLLTREVISTRFVISDLCLSFSLHSLGIQAYWNEPNLQQAF